MRPSVRVWCVVGERWESVPASDVRVGDVVRFRFGDVREVVGIEATETGIFFRFDVGGRGRWCRPTELVARRVV